MSGHVCECEPGYCGGCDPTPDWRWLCHQHGCRVWLMVDSLRGARVVNARPPVRYRQQVIERKAADAAAQAGGQLFADGGMVHA